MHIFVHLRYVLVQQNPSHKKTNNRSLTKKFVVLDAGRQKLNLSSHRQQLGGKLAMVSSFLVSNAIILLSLLVLQLGYYFIVIITTYYRDDVHSQSF